MPWDDLPEAGESRLLFASYCCVTNYPKRSHFKPHGLLSPFLWVRTPGAAQRVLCFTTSHNAAGKVPASSGVSSEGSCREGSTSKLIDWLLVSAGCFGAVGRRASVPGHMSLPNQTACFTRTNERICNVRIVWNPITEVVSLHPDILYWLEVRHTGVGVTQGHEC